MKKFLTILVLLANCGCAMIIPGTALEMTSTLLTLGNVGQTIVKMTAAESGKMAVGPLPQQYSSDQERMVREAWEQNFLLAKKTSWVGEEIPWKELVAATARKTGNSAILFALVEKRGLRNDIRREEVTVYKTVSGKTVLDPAQAMGEAFYPLVQTQNITVPVYLYTAWFFSRSRQPSGILAGDTTSRSSCGPSGAYIVAIGKNTPANKSGLLAGDFITSINGHAVEYATLFAALRPGQNAVTFCRNGQIKTCDIPLPEPKRR